VESLSERKTKRHDPEQDRARPRLDQDVQAMVYAFMATHPTESMEQVVNKMLRLALSGKYIEEVTPDDAAIRLENGKVLRPQKPIRQEWNL
jgi:hypothetical protein